MNLDTAGLVQQPLSHRCICKEYETINMLRSTLEAKETQGGLREPEPNVNRWFVTQRASVELDSATETSIL